MTPEAAGVLERAMGEDLCTCVVVGIRANGDGLFVVWSGETIHSLVTHLAAAQQLAVESFIEATRTNKEEA
jgi:hypothetical protein